MKLHDRINNLACIAWAGAKTQRSYRDGTKRYFEPWAPTTDAELWAEILRGLEKLGPMPG
ncbi:MAG: hypothetical protein WEB00_07345 [Dehalococcoidia bacterium]